MRTALMVFGLALWFPLVGRSQAVAVAQVPEGSTTVAEAAIPTYVEEMPAFPGGATALHHYLALKTDYPAEALRRRLSGTVVIRFVVDEQGRVLDPQIVRASSPEFSPEALRLVRLMPWWTPGRQAGQAVRVRCTLPIQFTFRR